MGAQCSASTPSGRPNAQGRDAGTGGDPAGPRTTRLWRLTSHVNFAMSSARKSTLTTPAALIGAGLVAPERGEELEPVAQRYAIALPPALAGLIDPNDPADPIARQFLPDRRELDRGPGEIDDPIGDGLKSPVRGLVHRYRDRVLLKLVSICAVYCRFCFRREMVGPGTPGLDEADLAAALDYIAARPEIWEVVLTGGDPLALSARRCRNGLARARRNPSRQSVALAYAPAGRGARARHGEARPSADLGPRKNGLCRAPRQPSARTDE